MPNNPVELRRRLHALAMRQAGYFTAAQALDIGYSYQSQKYHADRASWVRVDRGIFRLPDWPAQQEEVYVLWRLWSRHQAIVSHESALALHDLGDVNPALVHLTVPPGFRAEDPSVVLHKAVLPTEDTEERPLGYLLTTVIRTLLDAAAGDMSQEQLDTAVEDAIERELVSPRRLRSRSDKQGDRAAKRIERALGVMGR
ncbi:Transcriptional regulator, AbiEi antitoxin, Type IV TA system [Streptomyces sp. 2231.1]|uniref:type IV toxin-antitoxin system AbiEi family antitoxin domain-containing protein n=1 Tax=Streptomyces sp. 2231.1 TaxID=1855347 RepID=UPI0008947916|nr:hypothetical protein [Streptomyces sp. 2231.1]SED75859.1 Transcriptional regulator, AbiEi antitoxin, Type IV TA system [Streptomyces sp. 2231.1]